jgi:drug/metabolite transporter (DMT)-like permease
VNAPVHLALIFVQVLFGALPIAAKIVFREMSPALLTVARVAGAAAVFLALHLLFVREPIPPARDIRRLVLYSLLGISANQWLYLEGLSRTTALNAQILITSIPALTVAAAILLRRESAAPTKWVGVAVAGAGALYLIGVERFDPTATLGNALVLANSTCYAFYLVLARDLLVRYRASTFAMWIFLFATISLLPLGIAGVATAGVPSLGGPAAGALAFAVAGPTVGAYFLSVWALKRVHSSLVAVYVYLQPIVAGALAAWILDEPISPRVAPAAVLVFAGVAIVAWAERRPLVAPAAGS